MENFIILIGGPGLFKGCDKAHDQYWANYFVPMQLAAIRGLYNTKNEKVHWVVYEPSYINRWIDDSVISKDEEREDDGYNLHTIRKEASNSVLSKGASSYLNRIQSVANSRNIKYKGINSPEGFWNYLKSLPNNSVSRVWYCGHASDHGLMLSLRHSDTCEPVANSNEFISGTSIQKQWSDIKSINRKSNKISIFYGCNTAGFAKIWNRVYSTPASGMQGKIDFSVINKSSDEPNILKRIENTSFSVVTYGNH